MLAKAKNIGEKLITLRGNKSQEEVARKINVSLSALQAYEQGDRMPRDEVKQRLADYYGCKAENIFLI